MDYKVKQQQQQQQQQQTKKASITITTSKNMVNHKEQQPDSLVRSITKSTEELTIQENVLTTSTSGQSTTQLTNPPPTTTTTTTTTTTSMTTNTSNSVLFENDNGNGNGSVVIEHLKPEVEYGNIEYKLQLINPTPDRLEHLTSQMKWRIGEGAGECLYELGVSDDGTAVGLSNEDMESSLETLNKMAKKLNADLTIIRERPGLSGGKVVEALIRKYASTEDFSEIRVVCCGNVDAGKSTLLGVLKCGVLDDGRGKARLNVFRHRHEVESGRTSSISQEIVGFDSKGKIVNYNTLHSSLSPSEICESSSKIITFVDLAGHEKYLKTTLFGMTSSSPDYCMIAVGANTMGATGMCKEHLGIALSLHIPVYIVITKIDRAPENVLAATMTDIKKILRGPGARKLPVVIKNQDDVVVAARNFVSDRVVPIFTVSNVTGENLDLLRMFLNLLPARKEWESLALKPAQLDIDSTWNVSGVGTVVSGTVMKGVITAGETLLIGPDDSGNFIQTQVKSIHTKRLPVKHVKAGQTASLALKRIKKEQIRKGMVIIHPSAKPQATREFIAEVLILFHSTTISKNYESVIHCLSTTQSARLIEMDKEVLRTGDRARVKFRYLHRPQFLTVGSKFVIREGRSKGIGRIIELCPFVVEPIVHKISNAHGHSNAHLTNAASVIKKQTVTRAQRLKNKTSTDG
ncbi:hypothetical protein ACTA71_003433 [Dictyostelium dimigraforme]